MTRLTRLPRLAMLLLAMLCGTTALAHSALVKSTPAQAAVLTAAPKMLELEFNEPTLLTAVTIDSMDGQSHKVEPLPASAQAKVSLPAPALGAGRHELRWRGMGTDGHVVSGAVRFSIAR